MCVCVCVCVCVCACCTHLFLFFPSFVNIFFNDLSLSLSLVVGFVVSGSFWKCVWFCCCLFVPFCCMHLLLCFVFVVVLPCLTIVKFARCSFIDVSYTPTGISEINCSTLQAMSTKKTFARRKTRPTQAVNFTLQGL